MHSKTSRNTHSTDSLRWHWHWIVDDVTRCCWVQNYALWRGGLQMSETRMHLPDGECPFVCSVDNFVVARRHLFRRLRPLGSRRIFFMQRGNDDSLRSNNAHIRSGSFAATVSSAHLRVSRWNRRNLPSCRLPSKAANGQCCPGLWWPESWRH